MEMTQADHMNLMRDYYRSYLSDDGKVVYDLILDDIHKLATDNRVVIDLKNPSFDLNNACKAYHALRNDRPEFYFMGNSVKATLLGRILTIHQEKRFSYDQIKRINRLLRETVDHLVSDSYDERIVCRERNIYTTIAKTYTYGEGRFSHDLSGLLVFGQGVCEALAGLLVIALRESDIPAVKVRGIGKKSPHCWTKVMIGGSEYHLDVTWDLQRIRNNNKAQYFNLNEKKIKKDHIIEMPGY